MPRGHCRLSRLGSACRRMLQRNNFCWCQRRRLLHGFLCRRFPSAFRRTLLHARRTVPQGCQVTYYRMGHRQTARRDTPDFPYLQNGGEHERKATHNWRDHLGRPGRAGRYKWHNGLWFFDLCHSTESCHSPCGYRYDRIARQPLWIPF